MRRLGKSKIHTVCKTFIFLGTCFILCAKHHCFAQQWCFAFKIFKYVEWVRSFLCRHLTSALSKIGIGMIWMNEKSKAMEIDKPGRLSPYLLVLMSVPKLLRKDSKQSWFEWNSPRVSTGYGSRPRGPSTESIPIAHTSRKLQEDPNNLGWMSW